jgi:putative glutamine amidotransferase
MGAIIGVTLDWEDGGGYSLHQPWYALRDNYFQAIVNSGGVPIGIPHQKTAIAQYIEMIDGLVVTGGDYDIDPEMYNEHASNGMRAMKNNRANFERELILAAMEKKIPILGICAGEQLMAVIFGGKLIQDIPTEIGTDIIHEQSVIGLSHHKTIHNISIRNGSLLHKISGALTMKVNSTHHQAVKSVGPEMIVCANAPDGIIEAIEHISYPFLLGVEWHPEYENSKEDTNIFAGLVEEALNSK